MVIRWGGSDLVEGPDGRYHRPEDCNVSIKSEAVSDDEERRLYKVIIDGVRMENVLDGSLATFKLRPGSHRMRVGTGWTASHIVRFDIGPGETRTFLCRRKRRGPFGIELHPVSRDSTAQ